MVPRGPTVQRSTGRRVSSILPARGRRRPAFWRGSARGVRRPAVAPTIENGSRAGADSLPATSTWVTRKL